MRCGCGGQAEVSARSVSRSATTCTTHVQAHVARAAASTRSGDEQGGMFAAHAEACTLGLGADAFAEVGCGRGWRTRNLASLAPGEHADPREQHNETSTT